MKTKNPLLKENFDKLFKTKINPMMEAHGLKVSGKTWHQLEDRVLKFIDIELSNWNTKVDKHFSFNIKIFTGNIHEIGKINDKNIGANIFQYIAPGLNLPAGYFWGRDGDTYTVSVADSEFLPHSKTTDIDQLATTIENDFDTHIFSWYDKIHTIDDVIAFFKTQNQKLGTPEFSMAIGNILAMEGKKEESIPFFQEAVGDKEMIRKHAKQIHGVDI